MLYRKSGPQGGTVADIAFDNVTKRYGDTLAVEDLDLHIENGEFMVLVGPSGCGKTTALRMIAGLEDITRGEIRISDRIVNDVPPKDRDIAMVFQNYALYPHMSVYDNMAFGLKRAKVNSVDIDRRVKEGARILGLEEFLNRRPRTLSGGQRQRVAMGRAIVRKPQAFLMDEPLSNLDAKLRVQMRSEIARIQSDLNVTTVYVTHDQVEAMTMGDRVCVIRKGELQQVGNPASLFEQPASLFVGGFIGSPSMNFFASRLQQNENNYQVEIGDQVVAVAPEVFEQRPALRGYAGKEIICGVRPQDFEDAALKSDAPRDQRIKIRIELLEAIGTETLVHFEVAAPIVVTDDMRELAEDVGREEAERLEQKAREGHNEFVAQLDPKTRITKGETAELYIDTSRLHFFDEQTSEGIY
jgi:multiple sugar transport system ATP-binding protein